MARFKILAGFLVLVAAIFAAIFYFLRTTTLDCRSKEAIDKVLDFELSPDEERIAFTARKFPGSSDLWVVDINGKNLKRFTFSEYSLMNKIARFFEKRRWRGYYEAEIDLIGWTTEGKIWYRENISLNHIWGVRSVSLKHFTIKPGRTDKRPKIKSDKIFRRIPFDGLHRFDTSVYSEKHKKKFYLKENSLWFLNDGSVISNQLIEQRR